MTGPEQEQARRILEAFRAAGAEMVELPVLLPAGTLLDLYGEDMRRRAYTVRDPVAGELMLRPDFTVPVLGMHLERGAGEARYAYSGKVFRMQESGAARPSEYEQVGFERFGGPDPVEADADVFALFADILQGLRLRVATGDTGVLRAAIEDLSAGARRKAALARHLWRPGRFRRLLDRYSGEAPPPGEPPGAPREGGEEIGLRTRAEVEARLARVAEDADEAPIPAGEAAVIGAILELKDKLPAAVERLAALLGDAPVVRRMRARVEALARRGVDVERVEFEGSYGRASMEYYDGFVFGFYAGGKASARSVANGGRYDALARALGGEVPAVGGVARPALVAELAR